MYVAVELTTTPLLNSRDGPPVAQQASEKRTFEFREPSAGVEVSYEHGNEELVWI